MRKLLVVVVALFLTACVSLDAVDQDTSVDPQSSPRFEQDAAPPPRSSTAEIVEKVLPSLVNVRVRGSRGPARRVVRARAS